MTPAEAENSVAAITPTPTDRSPTNKPIIWYKTLQEPELPILNPKPYHLHGLVLAKQVGKQLLCP